VLQEVVGSDGYLTASKAIYVPAAFLMTLPLAFRRRAPFVVALVVMGTMAVQARAVGSAPTPDSEVFGALLAVYSAAAHCGPGRAQHPSPGALGARVEQGRGAGVPVELRIDDGQQEIPADVALCGYRVVQEALTNVLKHAGAARASVLVRSGAESLLLEIVDDGRGHGQQENGGHGLVGMRERVALYGGQFTAGRQNGGGFAVRAGLPLQPRPA